MSGESEGQDVLVRHRLMKLPRFSLAGINGWV